MPAKLQDRAYFWLVPLGLCRHSRRGGHRTRKGERHRSRSPKNVFEQRNVTSRYSSFDYPILRPTRKKKKKYFKSKVYRLSYKFSKKNYRPWDPQQALAPPPHHTTTSLRLRRIHQQSVCLGDFTGGRTEQSGPLIPQGSERSYVRPLRVLFTPHPRVSGLP